MTRPIAVPSKSYPVYQRGFGRTSFFRAQPLQGGMGMGFRGQHGQGIGSFLGGLVKRAAPLLKRVAVKSAKRALKSGGEILENVIVHKQPVRSAVRQQMGKEFTLFKNKSVKRLTGKRKSKSIKGTASKGMNVRRKRARGVRRTQNLKNLIGGKKSARNLHRFRKKSGFRKITL